MNIKLKVIILLLIAFSCSNSRENSHKNDYKNESVNLKYANGFKINKIENYRLITVLNPWSGANNVEYQYLLVDKNEELPEFACKFTVIRTPIEKAVCLSTTHVAFIDILNKTESIVGVSGTDFVNNEKVRKNIDKKKVFDVGYDSNLNYELIVGIQPDLVITYGVGGEIAGYNQRLNDLGVNTVMNAEYLEDNPLGKLEWIKFIAAFYNMENEANLYFDKIEKEYNALLEITKGVIYKPKVLIGLPYKDSWYVPGGKSFLAKMVEDAGGDYLWKENDSRESQPFNTESIFAKATKADIWIHTGSSNNKNDILKVDERFGNFKPFNESIIFNNNLRMNSFGGNDYWETGLVEPNIVLKDMIKIFHPELIRDHQLVYYKQIN